MGDVDPFLTVQSTDMLFLISCHPFFLLSVAIDWSVLDMRHVSYLLDILQV